MLNADRLNMLESAGEKWKGQGVCGARQSGQHASLKSQAESCAAKNASSEIFVVVMLKEGLLDGVPPIPLLVLQWFYNKAIFVFMWRLHFSGALLPPVCVCGQILLPILLSPANNAFAMTTTKILKNAFLRRAPQVRVWGWSKHFSSLLSADPSNPWEIIEVAQVQQIAKFNPHFTGLGVKICC